MAESFPKHELTQQFLTINRFSEHSLKEKGSEFITQTYPLFGANGFQEVLTDVRKKYYDATHHCFAVKTLGQVVKYSDDGEPGGTAGVRILQAIEHFKLTEILVIVIRYFGGTKLGIGPLGKAYFTSAYEALSMSEIKSYHLFNSLELYFPHEFISSFYRLCAHYQIKQQEEIYLDDVQQKIWIQADQIAVFSKELLDITSGKVKIKESNEAKYF